LIFATPDTAYARGLSWLNRVPGARKVFFFRHFERIFVLLLVLAMAAIHALVEQKFAFLSFYYLPMILAGFYGGRRFAVMAGVFVVALVFYYQYFQGLDMLPASTPTRCSRSAVGGLPHPHRLRRGRAGRAAGGRLAEVKNAYMATLELLTYHIESAERNQQGHSNRVAEVAAAIGRELELTEVDVENLRVAALLHEVGTRDQRLLRLLSRSVTGSSVGVRAPCAAPPRSSESTGTITRSWGEDWDIEALPLPLTVKILAVADAFETLQMATPVRPAFPKWTALEEVEKGRARHSRKMPCGRCAASRAGRRRRARGGPESRLGPGRELERPPPAGHSPSHPYPERRAVQTVTSGSAATGRATTVAASPARSGAAGFRTASTKRNRRVRSPAWPGTLRPAPPLR